MSLSTDRDHSLVLATGNAGKAREFGRLLAPVFTVEPLPPHIALPEETGATFRENARLKAEAVFVALGGARAVLADDSGLEVDALGGYPGVLSARYAGEHAGDADNVAKLLANLEGNTQRTARFVCCLCLLLPAASPSAPSSMLEVRGEAEGVIEEVPSGTDGFGYDPVFRPAGWTQTLAAADPRRKDEVSHRGAAVRSLLRLLEESEGTHHGP